MNKYYVGFALPDQYRDRLLNAQALIRGTLAETTRVLPPEEFHITSLFLGKCPREAAESLLDTLTWGLGSVYFRFDGLDVFKQSGKPHALVLKLHDLYGNAEHMHNYLRDAACAHPRISMNGKRWPYNPHVTLAKCEGVYDDALVTARHAIEERMQHNIKRHDFHCDQLALFEKGDGMTTYEVCRVLKIR